MDWDTLSYWGSIFVSGLQVGTFNPCALVVLWFFVVFLSEEAKTSKLLLAGGCVFCLLTVIVNVLLTFGDLDRLTRYPAFQPMLFGAHGAIVLIFFICGCLHLWDWWRHKFQDISVDRFKIALPVFWKAPQRISLKEKTMFFLKGIILAVFFNIGGVAWGHDYALFIAFSQSFFSMGPRFALILMGLFLVGYMLPMIIVWILVACLAKFQGLDRVPAYQISLYKMIIGALSLAISVILGAMLVREYLNI